MKRLWHWLLALVPSDEMMEARPENDAEIKRRMNELESLRAIVAARHVRWLARLTAADADREER